MMSASRDEPDRFHELEELLIRWEADEFDESNAERFREILRSQPGALKHFAKWQVMTAALHSEATLEFSGPLDAPRSNAPRSDRASTKQPRNRLVDLVVVAVTAASLMLPLAWIWQGSGSRQRLAAQGESARGAEMRHSGVAFLSQVAGASGAEADGVQARRLQAGRSIQPGLFEIERGVAQLEFLSGAVLILEGPAKLDVVSADTAILREGKLRANVPPAARGFRIEGPDFSVVDLGTEFVMSASHGSGGVEVIDGEIEVRQPGEPVTLLNEGDRFGDLAAEAFADSGTLRARAKQQEQRRHEEWMLWSNELQRDPRLVVFFDFANVNRWERRLPCKTVPLNTELDGAIVGAKWARGRWPQPPASESAGDFALGNLALGNLALGNLTLGNRGLEFKQATDRVRLTIPGQYESLSFHAWVKIDSLDRLYNSLFLTDNYNRGEPHWQILDTGQLFFSVCVQDENGLGNEHREVLSPKFWTPSLSGKWIHLVTTYDVDGKRVAHYLNGERLHEEDIPESQLARETRFGPSTLGNWTSPQRDDADFAIRNLNGSFQSLRSSRKL